MQGFATITSLLSKELGLSMRRRMVRALSVSAAVAAVGGLVSLGAPALASTGTPLGTRGAVPCTDTTLRLITSTGPVCFDGVGQFTPNPQPAGVSTVVAGSHSGFVLFGSGQWTQSVKFT